MKFKIWSTLFISFHFMGALTYSQSLNFSGGYTISSFNLFSTSSSFNSKGIPEGEFTDLYSGTNYDVDSYFTIKNIHGFNIAVGYELPLNERFSLVAGLKYQTRGFQTIREYEVDDGTNSFSESLEYENRLNYLDLPVILNSFILLKEVKLYARTGVYLGYLVSGKLHTQREYKNSNGNSLSEQKTKNLAVSNYDSRVTGGVVVGFGAEYKLFYFETNCNLGSYMIGNSEVDEQTFDISFSLGYKWEFKK